MIDLQMAVVGPFYFEFFNFDCFPILELSSLGL